MYPYWYVKCDPVQPIGLYAKTKYQDKVKTTLWDVIQESKPLDNNPLCPLRVHMPHYNRLGYHPQPPWISATHDMLEEIHLKKDVVNANKKLLSYYTYNDKLDCTELKFYERELCPKFCANDYKTTMQYSYKAPRGLRMDRLALPTIPFNENRRFRHVNPYLSRYKFFDDSFPEEVCLLQRYKPYHQVSYNFVTGKRSDGTELPPSAYQVV